MLEPAQGKAPEVEGLIAAPQNLVSFIVSVTVGPRDGRDKKEDR